MRCGAPAASSISGRQQRNMHVHIAVAEQKSRARPPLPEAGSDLPQATGSDGAVAEQQRLAAEQLTERTSSNGASPSGASANGASANGASYNGAVSRHAQQNGASLTSNGASR